MKHLVRVLVTIFIVNVYLSSCNNYKQQDKQVAHQQTNERNTEVFEFPIKKFSLPYDTPLKCDSNSIIFLKQIPFDTSYLLHVKYQGSTAMGLCYFVLPSNHRDLEDFYDQQQQLLFFEGFSFKLNPRQWKTLKEKTDEAISNMPDSIMSGSHCLHCPSYSLYHDNKERGTGNSKLQENFNTYDAFIRDSLIGSLLAKKSLENKY